ncbi:hypothetical protein MKW98_032180 [Papaver atlanticum]|uniref:BHLH domain-containing protein n=1 Tax=Papaver atlanticum TaxID=357466 RepID=A0AAD4XDG6_9MAGN|nr:hypothetical protein MKW98_032180 [Papaver atlanticum]
MEDQDEPNFSQNIMISMSSSLVNHESPSSPQLQQVTSSNNHDKFLFSGTDQSSTPPLEISSSGTSSPPNIICFANPNSPANINTIDDPTKVGCTYANLATVGATVLVTNRNTLLYPTESHLHNHQGLYKGAIQAPAAENTTYSRRVKNAIVKPLVAERNRREKLNQHFIALSSQIPGLKKIDRASVLEEATKYMKQLKKKVKTLEEEQKSLKLSIKTTRSSEGTMDVANKKMKSLKCDDKQIEHSKNQGNKNYDSDDTDINDDDYSTSSYEGNYENEPEIEARVSHNNMFIRIQCEKNQGVLGIIIKEIEKLHLVVLQSSVMPSGSYTLYITIICQVIIQTLLTLNILLNATPLSCFWTIGFFL